MNNDSMEHMRQELASARAQLEAQGRQLALMSEHKAGFLANVSKELRTPVETILTLSKLLADNSEGNLTAKQVEFASVIHGSGTNLLALVNELLALAEAEANASNKSASA